MHALKQVQFRVDYRTVGILSVLHVDSIDIFDMAAIFCRLV